MSMPASLHCLIVTILRFGASPHREEEQEEPKVEEEKGGNAAGDERGEAQGSLGEVGHAQAALTWRYLADEQCVRHVHKSVQPVLLCTMAQKYVRRHPHWFFVCRLLQPCPADLQQGRAASVSGECLAVSRLLIAL